MFNIKKGKEEDINEEEKKVAEKLKELREAADEPETEQPDYSMYSPVEQLSTDKDAGSYHSSRGISTCLQLQGTWRTGHAEVEAQRLGKISLQINSQADFEEL